MVCSTVVDSSHDNSNECLVTKTIIGQISDAFNRCCDEMDSELGGHMLVNKIYIVMNIIFLIIHQFSLFDNAHEHEQVLKLKVKKNEGKFLSR